MRRALGPDRPAPGTHVRTGRSGRQAGSDSASTRGFARAMPEFPAAFAHSLAASVDPHPDRFFGELPPLEDDASR